MKSYKNVESRGGDSTRKEAGDSTRKGVKDEVHFPAESPVSGTPCRVKDKTK